MTAPTAFESRSGGLIHAAAGSVKLGQKVRALCGRTMTPAAVWSPEQWERLAAGCHTGYEGGTCPRCVTASNPAHVEIPEPVAADDGTTVTFTRDSKHAHMVTGRCSGRGEDGWGCLTFGGAASIPLALAWARRHLIQKHTPVRYSTCGNCDQPIRGQALAHGPVMDPQLVVIWDHHEQGHHTVCDWTPDMEPTDRVATPALSVVGV